jgi:endoglucanase
VGRLAKASLVTFALALSVAATASAKGDPFAGATFYVDSDSNASRQAEKWRATRPADAAAMQRIAATPQADWFGDWIRRIGPAVNARVSRIVAAGHLPVFVAYNIPHRDCGGYSAGGARNAAAYSDWIRGFARGLGHRRAAVVLEPDALAGIDCLSAKQERRRLKMLQDAVGVLGRAGASVYIDAGHSGWKPAGVMARRLRAAGVEHARGFALNVSNFRTTETEVDYGARIGRALRGKHFVIDTSRNGLGPAPNAQWCNPPGRALGPAATAATADPLADAYFWIKPPGESDGSCRGAPPAGDWFPEYALGLAQRAGF